MSRENDLLVRTLEQRSEQMRDSSVGLDDVKSRARGLQRRRRAMTGAVAAVVLAVAVPVGLSVTDAIQTQPLPPAEQTQTPNPDETDNAQPAPEFPEQPVRLTAEGLPAGEPPGLNYLVYDQEQELVTPSGTVALPEQVGSAAPYGDGWITIGGEGPLVRWLDSAGEVVRTEPAASILLAVGDDRSQVAWTQGRFGDREVQLVAGHTAGGEPRSWTLTPGDGEVRPVGFLGENRVVFTVIETSQNAIAEPDGSFTELEGFLSIRSASQAAGLVAVQTSYSSTRMCDGVVDPSASTSETLWETCEFELGEFSPDGRYVVGSLAEPMGDGFGSGRAAVLDARTGEVMVEFESEGERLQLSQILWEDATHLVSVVVATADAETFMLRLGLDGEVERIGPSGVIENMGLAFGFAEYRH
jgi:hypothetical protein